MLGNTLIFLLQLKIEFYRFGVTHYCLHRYVLATLSTLLKEILSIAVKIVKSKDLNHKIQKRMSRNSTHYEVLLCITQNCGRYLKRQLKCLFESRTEISIFLFRRDNPLKIFKESSLIMTWITWHRYF